MKKIFFTLVTILIIAIIASLTLIKISYDNKNKNEETSTDTSSNQPTEAPSVTDTPLPSTTSEATTDLFPAFQYSDGNIEYGYINSNGEFKLTPSFDTASDFHDGVAVVNMNDQYCIIDETGDILYFNDGTIEDFHNGAAAFLRISNDKYTYGYIDTDGKEIIEPKYIWTTNFSKEGTAYVSTDKGKFELIDKTGKTLESYELDSKYENPVSIQDGYVIYLNSDNSRYGVVTMKGDEILAPDFNDIRYLGEDMFAVIKTEEEVYGIAVNLPAALYNAKGEQLSDYSFYDISEFHNGYASATDSISTFFIGADGKEIKDLPSYEGRGTIELFGDIVKAEIDKDLIYSKKDGTILWQNDNTQKLTENIKVKSVKLKPNRNVLVYYPQVEGLTDTALQDQINSKLKGLFTDNRVGIKMEDALSVEDTFRVKLMGDLLIVERDGYDYPFGAAHGMPIMDFFYIDIKTGASYQLKDLFKEGSDYVSKINELIESDMKAQTETGDSMLFPETFKGISENQYFKISDNALIIYFYPYEVAAYAAGFPEFTIPFDELSEYINMDGNFWLSFR